MLDRENERKSLEKLLRSYPVVAILGPRQIGKTTLAKSIAAGRRGRGAYFDLEQRRDLQRLDDPQTALEDLRGLVVIDEIQRRPELFPALRPLADRNGSPARFLILGSATPALLKQASESLAGRIAYFDLEGLGMQDVQPSEWRPLWFRGGFPRSFLAGTDAESHEWRGHLIRSYLERDLPELGIRIAPATLDRFWTMLAHYHGQIWSGAEFARAFGLGEATVRRYLDVLANTYMVRILRPWSENVGKRVVKSPKVYVKDSGLLHALLELHDLADVREHPKVGASFEGFALGEVLRRLGATPRRSHFWATHQGAELDLLVVKGRRRLGFEFKHTLAPEVTKSMKIALEDLGLESIDVIHPGAETYPLTKKVRAVALERITKDIKPLG